MSGEGAYPFRTRLIGDGVNSPAQPFVWLGDPSGAMGSVATDHFFATPAAPGTVCIAALMNATAIVRPNLFGVAIQ